MSLRNSKRRAELNERLTDKEKPPKAQLEEKEAQHIITTEETMGRQPDKDKRNEISATEETTTREVTRII